MRLGSFKIGKSKEKTEEAVAEAGDTTEQAAVPEEPVDSQPEVSEATEPQPAEVVSTPADSKEGEGTPPQPHGPLGELEVGAEEIAIEKEADLEAPLEEAEEEVEAVKVDEVGTGAAAPAEAAQEPPKAEEGELGSLFSQDEDESNPLAALIESLPDVTIQELLDDIQEIKGIVQEWQK